MKKAAIITAIVAGALVFIFGVAAVAYAVPRLYLNQVERGYAAQGGLNGGGGFSCFNNVDVQAVELEGKITAVSEDDWQIVFKVDGKEYELFRCSVYLIANEQVKAGDEIRVIGFIRPSQDDDEYIDIVASQLFINGQEIKLPASGDGNCPFLNGNAGNSFGPGMMSGGGRGMMNRNFYQNQDHHFNCPFQD